MADVKRLMERLSPPAIGDYALLGDARTAALISRRGSINWLCIPAFDGEPVFGRLIDQQSGGRFELEVDGEVEGRSYRDGSAVLETRWRGRSGSAIVTEAMPVTVKGLRPQLALIREVRCTGGEVEARILFDPRLGLPGRKPRSSRRGPALLCDWGSIAVLLQCFGQDAPSPERPTSVHLRAGTTLTLVLSLADRTPAIFLTPADVDRLLAETDSDWKKWSGEIKYFGPFREAVIRSLITLRMLTFSPSGAPVAAPTTSLPERIGGDLNWDYRYAWPRDASLGSGAFMATGKAEEAKAFLRWLEIASRLTLPRMRVLYTLMGNPAKRERELRSVSGYQGSLPVRVSNLASEQHQLDVYGWVVDTAWHLVSMGCELDGPSWRMIRDLADFACTCWRDPDSGIWEERGVLRHYVSSKFLAFVALDRAARIARHRRSDLQKADHWERERDALRSDVREHGWNNGLNSYAASYDSNNLDASLLLLGMSELDGDRPERLRFTIDAIRRKLSAGGPLLYRYLPADGKATEGAFLACSFWLIDALARNGDIDEAERLMSEAIAFGGELGLLPEEIDPSSGGALGNFPQALSHSSLVGAALSIEEAKASRTRPG